MSSQSRRQGRLSCTSDVLQSLLQDGKSPLAKGFLRWRVWKEWPTVVGQEIARHTEPVDYRQGVLYVWVKNSTRMQEVSFLSRQIISKINEFVGRKWVIRIRYTLDPKSIPDREQFKGQLNKIGF